MKSLYYFPAIFIAMSLSCSAPKTAIQSQAKSIKERMSEKSFVAEQPKMPLLTGKENLLNKITFSKEGDHSFSEIKIRLKSSLKNLDLEEISVYVSQENDVKKATLFGKTSQMGNTISVKGDKNITKDVNYAWVMAKTTEKPNLLNTIKVSSVELVLPISKHFIVESKGDAQRFGISLRTQKQDGIECYRIPGLVTTNSGTLIAVYDNRYNNCKDLQEDINIGMSRSTDGGQTWEPMKEILDMKEWGGLPNELNGVGDPAILVDKQTGTIWVAALWLHGSSVDKMAWWESKPGMSPNETGQLVLTKSDDDGLTWSEPINITEQVKDQQWYLFFNGPGSGISLKDGKLVFAAQYKNSNQVPFSTLIYSADHGKTWKRGIGAQSHTTEAQVVELSDGSIMLNARDDRNRQNYFISDNLGGRSVFTTKNFGASWTEHPTSRKALVEPNCMASIISYEHPNGKRYLFFSNPADTKDRINITIKASDDDGQTWNKLPQKLLYSDANFGYSCMSIIDNQYIGILYEGNGDLYFQKIAISEFIK
ncbi:MAG: exo-alpha-sialidase [Capnocytophaga sp.]|nr:exo-alpha-sialidase [Capnocytophaga sp.]